MQTQGMKYEECGKEAQCGNCRFYFFLPRQKDKSGAVDMSVPQQGQCRKFPPSIVFTPQGVVSAFPLLPVVHAACHQYEPVVPQLDVT